MQKLVPHWGHSPQPGSTYYLQNLIYLDYRDDSAPLYIFDETVGHKTADHTISYILQFLIT